MKTRKKLYDILLILILIFLTISCGNVKEDADSLPAAGLQILIPLYNYPNWYESNYIWDDIAEASKKVRITAIINPDTGPDSCPPDEDYSRGIDDLRSGYITILGYVYTSNGARDPNDIKVDIDIYYQCYDIDGIFFDEVTSDADNIDYYEDLYNYVKSRVDRKKVFLNPGTHMNEGYLNRPAGDTIVIFENASEHWVSYQPDAYVKDYPGERFAMLLYNHNDPNTMESYIRLAHDRNIQYIYLTNDTMPNPWDTLPVFWQAEINFIASLND